MAEQDSSVSYQFTKLGNDLSVKALAGTVKLDFTKAELSTDNHFSDTEADVAIMTDMGNVAQTVELKEVDAVEDDQSYVKVPVLINEAEITEDYALMTIGLYCKPDDGDEVLYSICSLKDPIYMHKSSNNSTYSIDLNTLVGSSSNVVIKVDPAGMVTHADFDAMMKRVAFIDKANTFTEQQTLAGGAVDGKGNAIATTKNLADGDVETLTSAKAYVDTKVSGKADDSKVVHTADMRKPASDVAGIEEVNAKQDKIGYTPADDSKVVHSTVTQLNSTDMNTVVTAGFYLLRSGTNGTPSGDNHTIYQVIPFYSSNGVQLAYGTNNNISGMRSWNSYNHFTSWVQFADDSKVAHLSGANNFDTVPTVNNNPLLLASSLPSDLARTSQQTNFTAGLQSGGVDVATAADMTNAVADAKAAAITQALNDAKAEIAKLPKHVTLTQAQFDALATKDANTYYYITEG